MARKCKEDAEKTRQAVLEAALDVFTEKGYAKATFDEIALRAGFTKGAVYWYFRNKTDLVASLINEYIGRKHEELLTCVPEGNSFDDLLEYFMLWADAGRKDVRFSKFNRFILCQMEWSETIIERVDKSINEVKNWHSEKVNQVLNEAETKGILREDLDRNLICDVIISTYMGIVFSSLNKRCCSDVVDMVRTGLGVLFEGFKK